MTAEQASETMQERPGSGAMFDRIADRYDVVNRLMSLGLDQSWRRRAIRSLELEPGARVLDVATGTADVALEIARRVDDARVVGVDPSEGMLARGRRKVAEAGLGGRIELRRGTAEELPVGGDEDDGKDYVGFDGATIAWGIRNAADRPKALRAMQRSLRPGGRVAILESLEAQGTILAPFVRFYTRQVVPRVGALLSRSDEYRYLERSIAAFPRAEEFEVLMEEAGFVDVRSEALMFGACRLFVGRKPEPAADAADAADSMDAAEAAP